MRFPNHEQLTAMTALERQNLASELRSRIIDIVLRQGGHLASNLGAVELTIALHTVFDFRTDRLLFDVGHQCYAHKLLTGREDAMESLRARGGASGFPRPSESPWDAFAAGHSSTALSAALGMALARKQTGQDYKVVALVGDGAMTGGMFYEAMNMAGQQKVPLILVLNDNEMSIAPNVGALASHLSALRQSSGYRNARDAVKKGLENIPLVGVPLARSITAIKRGLRSLLIGEEFFESLGFSYFGPVDGHNTEKLIHTFRQIRNIDKPVLLHVLTKKGKGYAPAEAHPAQYHGISPANAPSRDSYSSVACQTLMEMAEKDEKIVTLTAAMPGGTGLEPFQSRFPRQFYDVGIAEEHMVTMAAGMAASGLHPYICIYSTFLQRAYDQILHDVCLQNLPVTLLIDRAGLSGADGSTHQGVFDLSFLRHIPNMRIASPRDAAELKAMIRLSRNLNAPFAIRYPKDAAESAARPEPDVALGTWEILRPGHTAALLAVGRAVENALAAAEILEKDGISLHVVNARYIKPMDEAMLASLAGMPLITMEENAVLGGFGSAVREKTGGRVLSLGVPDSFVSHGSISQQLHDCALDAPSAAEAIRKFINIKFFE